MSFATEIRGSSLRAFLWAAAIMFPIGVIGAALGDWEELRYLGAPIRDLVITDVLFFGVLPGSGWVA
jgi:hypothetical protein